MGFFEDMVMWLMDYLRDTIIGFLYLVLYPLIIAVNTVWELMDFLYTEIVSIFNIIPVLVNGVIGVISTMFLNNAVLPVTWVTIIVGMIVTTFLFKMYNMSKEFWYWIDRIVKGWL